MGIKVTIDGIQFEASTVAEALDLARGYKSGFGFAPKVPTPPKGNGLRYVPPAGAVDWTAAFLSTIRSAGNSGALTERIVNALDVDHPKAVGGRLAIVNRILASRGFKKENVYSNDKSPEGPRLWRPKAQMDAALAAVKELVT